MTLISMGIPRLKREIKLIATLDYLKTGCDKMYLVTPRWIEHVHMSW